LSCNFVGLVIEHDAEEERDPRAVGLPDLADLGDVGGAGRCLHVVGDRHRSSEARLGGGREVRITCAAEENQFGRERADSGNGDQLLEGLGTRE
jgi:hypothetical protein